MMDGLLDVGVKNVKTMRIWDKMVGKISIEQHLEELKECKIIIRELQRMVDTDGCYSPYNNTFDAQAEIVHESLNILKRLTNR